MATLSYERVAIATGRVNTKRAVDDIIAGRLAGDHHPRREGITAFLEKRRPNFS
jgi:hypothetical protein